MDQQTQFDSGRKLRLASLFSDGAVLQRGRAIPVWGTAAPDSMVYVSFAGKRACVRSSGDGNFILYLPEFPSGGPYEMKICSGEETVEIKDILIGDVWIAGGQSNMSYPLECGRAWVRRNYEKVLEQKDEFISSIKNGDLFRMITVPKNATGRKEHFFSADWKKLTPENAPEFSAVASWFGRTLQEKLDIPVGIISCNWGGSSVETWTSQNGLRRNPDTAPLLDYINQRSSSGEYWEKSYKEFAATVAERCGAHDPGNKGVELGYADIDFDDSTWQKMRLPGSWIKQNIAGNGVIWVRIALELPEDWAGCELTVYPGMIDKSDITYFNGVEIGRTGKGFDSSMYDVSRSYTVPAGIAKAGKNMIAIRAYSFLNDGAVNGTSDDFCAERRSDGAKICFAGHHPAMAEYDAGVLKADPDLEAWVPGNPKAPAMLFNSMVLPLIPYAFYGVIWYQGESNASTPTGAKQYCRKLRTMIEDWRYWWGQGDFPFIQVELANYHIANPFDRDSSWALLRESQNKVCGLLPEVGIVSALDCGDEMNIHPYNKKDVGLRLAGYVLSRYFGSGKAPRGPRFSRMETCGNSLKLDFDFADGLFFRGGDPKGFYLENINGTVAPADSVVIEGSRITVSSEKIPFPTGVWYSWSNNPDGNLYNSDDLTAMPFRAGSALFK